MSKIYDYSVSVVRSLYEPIVLRESVFLATLYMLDFESHVVNASVMFRIDLYWLSSKG